jgi:hypothetical protein
MFRFYIFFFTYNTFINPINTQKKEPGTDVFYHQGSGTASQATPRGRHRIRAGVGFELVI